jgi:hypothetical protein
LFLFVKLHLWRFDSQNDEVTINRKDILLNVLNDGSNTYTELHNKVICGSLPITPTGIRTCDTVVPSGQRPRVRPLSSEVKSCDGVY